MALRGFYNDDLSKPGRSSSGPERASDIARVIRKGGAVRSIYDGIVGVAPLSEMNSRPGLEVAGHVAFTVASIAEPGSVAAQLSRSFVSRFPDSHPISRTEPQADPNK